MLEYSEWLRTNHVFWLVIKLLAAAAAVTTLWAVMKQARGWWLRRRHGDIVEEYQKGRDHRYRRFKDGTVQRLVHERIGDNANAIHLQRWVTCQHPHSRGSP